MKNLSEIIFLSFFLISTVSIIELRAEQNEISSPVKVFVIKVAKDPKIMEQELRFIDELQLALDEMEVQVVEAPNEEFRDDTLGNQILWVKSILKEMGAVAGVWLAPISKDLLLLHMVVARTHRTIVRMVQVESKLGFETDLALFTRESLGEAFLLSEEEVEPAITEVVDEVRSRARKPENGTSVNELQKGESGPSGVKWSTVLAPVIEGRLLGGSGPPLLLGGSLALDFSLTESFGLYAQFSVIGGPFGKDRQGTEISSLSLLPGAGVFYLFNLEKLSIGPSIDFQAVYTNLTISISQVAATTSRLWRFRMGANLEAFLDVSPHVSLFAAAGVTFLPLTDQYAGDVSGEIYYETPRLGWRSLLGLSLHP